MIYLSSDLWFPPHEYTTEEGLLALGGDLSSERLLLAYRSGIFPWFSEGEPILWWSPDPRMVLFPDELKVSKSLKRTLKKEIFKVTFNTHFSEVIQQCAQKVRPGQESTWITQEMIEAYEKLHEMGHAKSVEVWKDDRLVGGLYGIDLPEYKVFCGESMFSHESDASKVGFYYWVQELKSREYRLIDCQIHTAHLESLGAKEIPRSTFMRLLGD
ncbi:leucyl/phenylalanyl-tRNA--protein transferase [Aureisphaera galaxeae]|uniref:leucyl/phenylalanyl-tRNA--protein transferase n=1 Tax=Aureisphaera galaxeae TaxID=1538023 RepID=UPI002350DA78|nr:leucyl/phenylalanyl-tRNA--protein transferase [Aureisphaera galaxeae]MDC8002765.1 leucyl/phenylalanyl-tRNA--protein transferase [Aureisphaera galaxeae]